jgi:hypothetical protein
VYVQSRNHQTCKYVYYKTIWGFLPGHRFRCQRLIVRVMFVREANSVQIERVHTFGFSNLLRTCFANLSLIIHSLSKTWFGNSAKVFVVSFCSRLCSFVHGARSMNTLYFSIMNESSNSNVSVGHSTMLFKYQQT